MKIHLNYSKYLLSVRAFKMNRTEPLQPSSTAPSLVSTFVFFEEMVETPYGIKIPCGSLPGKDKPYVTLAMFKDALSARVPGHGSYRYFFKDDNPETLPASQWEATNDNQELPLFEGKIIAHLKKRNEPVATGQSSDDVPLHGINLQNSVTSSSGNQQGDFGENPQTMEQSCKNPHFVEAYFHYGDWQEVPHQVRIPSRTFSGNDQPLVTLAMLREHLPKRGNFHYFFKRQCPITKATFNWQATEDTQELPLADGRIIALLKEMNQSSSLGQYPNANPMESSTLQHALDLSEIKTENMDYRFREFVGVFKDDVDKMRGLVAKMQGVLKCYTQDTEKYPEENAGGLAQMLHAVDDAEIAEALKTIKTWLLQRNMNSEALGHLAKLENICFPDGF